MSLRNSKPLVQMNKMEPSINVAPYNLKENVYATGSVFPDASYKSNVIMNKKEYKIKPGPDFKKINDEAENYGQYIDIGMGGRKRTKRVRRGRKMRKSRKARKSRKLRKTRK